LGVDVTLCGLFEAANGFEDALPPEPKLKPLVVVLPEPGAKADGVLVPKTEAEAVLFPEFPKTLKLVVGAGSA
jgi:hypothetical protein